MTILQIVFLLFCLLELSNVIMMYFAPGSKNANAVGIFTAWEKSKQYPEIHDFIKYLVYWVAGTKLIFIFLLIGIVIFADPKTQLISGLIMIVSISTFYWRLFPLIRKMDLNGQIVPRNYSIILGVMIFVFICIYIFATAITYF